MNGRILVAVAEKERRESLISDLAHAGFQPQGAGHWLTALLRAWAAPPALVCLDPNLPGMSDRRGLRLLERLCGSLPVVLVPLALMGSDEILGIISVTLGS